MDQDPIVILLELDTSIKNRNSFIHKSLKEQCRPHREA